MKDAQETGYVDPARFLSGLERMQDKARSSGYIAVDYEFLTTFLSTQSIQQLTRAGHIKLKRYKVVKVKKDSAHSFGDYVVGTLTGGLVGKGSSSLLRYGAKKTNQAVKAGAKVVGSRVAEKGITGMMGSKALSVATKATRLGGPVGWLGMGAVTTFIDDMNENDNTLEFAPLDDPREAYNGMTVVLYEIDETVLKQIAQQFGTTRFDTSNEKLMNQARRFLYQKAGGYGATKARWGGRGGNESIGIGSEYKALHDFDNLRAAHEVEENTDEYSRRKQVAFNKMGEIFDGTVDAAKGAYKGTKDFFTKPTGEKEVVYDPGSYVNRGGIGARSANIIHSTESGVLSRYGGIRPYLGKLGKLRSPSSTGYIFSTESAVKEAQRLCKLIIVAGESPKKWKAKGPNERGKSKCKETYARLAIAKGLGMTDLKDHPKVPFEFVDILYKYGFAPISWESYSSQKGDICVFGPTPKHPGGYVSIFSGSKWISDFEQHEMWPYDDFKVERCATVFRHLKTISDKAHSDLLKDQYDIGSAYEDTGFIDFDGDGKWDAMKTSDGSIYQLNEDGSLGKTYTPEELRSLWTSNSVFSAYSGESAAGYQSSGSSGPSHYDAMTVSGLGGQSPWAKAVIIVKSWWEKNVHEYSHDNRSGCVPLKGGHYRPDCSGFVGACLVLYGIPVYDPSKRTSSAPRSVEYYSNGTGLQKLLEQGGFQKAVWPNDNSGLAPFDILVKNGHVEIYAGQGMSYNWGSVHDLSKGGMPSKHSWHGTHIYRCVNTPSHVGQDTLIKNSSDTINLGSWDASAEDFSTGFVGSSDLSSMGGTSFGWTGSGAASGGGTTGGRITSDQAKQNAISVVNFLMKKGLTKEQALGVAGNIMGESGFNPSAIGDKGTSGGLAQWHGKRFTALQNFATSIGRDWRDPEVQMEYLWHELNTTESNTLRNLRRAGSVEEASRVWGHDFERFSGYENYGNSKYSERADYARQVGEAFGIYGEEKGIHWAGIPDGKSELTESITEKINKAESFVKSIYNDVSNAVKNILPTGGPQFITLDKDSNKKIEAMSDDQLAAQIWLNNPLIRNQYDSYGFEGWKKNVFDKKSRKDKQRYLIEEEGKALFGATTTTSDGNGYQWSGLGNILGNSIPEGYYDSLTGSLTPKGISWFSSVYAAMSPKERTELTKRLQLERQWHDTTNNIREKYSLGDYSEDEVKNLEAILAGGEYLGGFKDVTTTVGSTAGTTTTITSSVRDPEFVKEFYKNLQLGNLTGAKNLLLKHGINPNSSYSDEDREVLGGLLGNDFSTLDLQDTLARAFAKKQYDVEQEKINNILKSEDFKVFNSMDLDKAQSKTGSGDRSLAWRRFIESLDEKTKLKYGNKAYTGISGGVEYTDVDFARVAEGYSKYLANMYELFKGKYVQQHLTEGFEDILESDTGAEAYEKNARNQKRAEINQKKYALEYQKDHWQDEYNSRYNSDEAFRKEMLWKYGRGEAAFTNRYNSKEGQDEVEKLNKSIEELNEQLSGLSSDKNLKLQDIKSIKEKFEKIQSGKSVVSAEEFEKINNYATTGAQVYDETLNKLIAEKQNKVGRELNQAELKDLRSQAENSQYKHVKENVWESLMSELIGGTKSEQEARYILNQQGLGDFITNDQIKSIKKDKAFGANLLQTAIGSNGEIKFYGADGKEIQIDDVERDKDGNIVLDKKTKRPKKIKRGISLDDTEHIQKLMDQMHALQTIQGGVGEGDVTMNINGKNLSLYSDNTGMFYYDPETGRRYDRSGREINTNIPGGMSSTIFGKPQLVSQATNLQQMNFEKRLREGGYSIAGETFTNKDTSVYTQQFDMSKYEDQDRMIEAAKKMFGEAFTAKMQNELTEQFNNNKNAKVEVSTFRKGNQVFSGAIVNGQFQLFPDDQLAAKELNAMEQHAKKLGFSSEAAKVYAESQHRERQSWAEVQQRMDAEGLNLEGMTATLLQDISNQMKDVIALIPNAGSGEGLDYGNGGTGTGSDDNSQKGPVVNNKKSYGHFENGVWVPGE